MRLRFTILRPLLMKVGTAAALTLGATVGHRAEVDAPWLALLSPVREAKAHGDSELAFHLEKVEPNPFVEGTSLQFSVTEAVRLEISVYDALGRWVCTLAHRSYAVGSHPVLWDGRDAWGNDIARGVYLIRISDGINSESRKVTRLK